jgi:3-methyladenine DNA glycosylase AlkD
MLAARRLASATRKALAARADPAKAPFMQAYMKSAMPYYGVASPVQVEIWRDVFSLFHAETIEEWRDAALTLWRGARFREERYGALAWTGLRQYRAYQTPDALPLYEEFIVTGAWWDYVDLIASRRIGPILASHPRRMSVLMRRWSLDRNLWKRRTAILAQLGFKERTDLDLLYACIEPNLGDREFFIRKAIGWALRQSAWTDPREVARYVRAHEDRLSPLSRREAVKNIEGFRL